MKIAVTYENEEVFQHFGHTKKIKIYEIEGKLISNAQVLDTEGSGHGALAKFLSNNNVNALICGGIGSGARTALKDAGIELYPGVVGNADQAIKDFIEGNLKYNPDIKCNHHHEEGHHCGEDKHGCSSND